MTTNAHTLIPDLLARSARLHPNRTALVSPAWRLSYGDVHARSNALAHALEERGIRRGDTVVVLGRGSVQTAIALWATLKANATVAVVPSTAPPAALGETIELHGARVLVAEARLMGTLRGLEPDPRTLEHVLVCGAVGVEELPELPGAVCASVAMLGRPRRVPPLSEARPTDVALAAVVGSGAAARTHREALAGLPEEPNGDETHEVGLLETPAGVDRMLRVARDGASLRLVPRPRPVARPPETPSARTP